MSDPFATAGELAQFIGTNEPGDLARMQMDLDLASALIRSYTGQTLSPVVGDEIEFLPTHSLTLYLPERPVTAVTTIEVDSVPITDHVAYGGWIYRDAGWLDGATVTYDHGYPEGSTDYQLIKKICLEAAANAFTMNRQGADEVLGGVLGSVAPESAGWAPAVFLTPSQMQQLGKYRLVAVG